MSFSELWVLPIGLLEAVLGFIWSPAQTSHPEAGAISEPAGTAPHPQAPLGACLSPTGAGVTGQK